MSCDYSEVSSAGGRQVLCAAKGVGLASVWNGRRTQDRPQWEGCRKVKYQRLFGGFAQERVTLRGAGTWRRSSIKIKCRRRGLSWEAKASLRTLVVDDVIGVTRVLDHTIRTRSCLCRRDVSDQYLTEIPTMDMEEFLDYRTTGPGADASKSARAFSLSEMAMAMRGNKCP